MSILVLLFSLVLSSPAFALSVVTGSYTGDTTDDRDIAISPACQPKAVIVKNNGASSAARIMTDTMSTNSSGQFSANAQGAANEIQQLNSDGFEVGTVLNGSGVVFRYVAFCNNGAGDIETGTYTGASGTDNRNITMVSSWTPELVIIIGCNAEYNVWRGATSHSGDSASKLNFAEAEAANLIQSFGAGTFQLGSLMNVNACVYHWIAFKGSSSGVATGNFAGNTSDDRDITVTSFTPEFALVRSAAATNATGSYRFTSNAATESFCTSAAATTNQIQAFGATSFQVGTSACANENGQTMRWFALADVATSRRPQQPIPLGE